MNELRTFCCQSGHTWDVFGTWQEGPPPYPGLSRTFVPDDMKLCCCPECDGIAVNLDGEAQESLA